MLIVNYNYFKKQYQCPVYDDFCHFVCSCCSGQHLWRPGKQGHVKGKGGASGAGHKDTVDDTEDFSL